MTSTIIATAARESLPAFAIPVQFWYRVPVAQLDTFQMVPDQDKCMYELNVSQGESPAPGAAQKWCAALTSGHPT